MSWNDACLIIHETASLQLQLLQCCYPIAYTAVHMPGGKGGMIMPSSCYERFMSRRLYSSTIKQSPFIEDSRCIKFAGPKFSLLDCGFYTQALVTASSACKAGLACHMIKQQKQPTHSFKRSITHMHHRMWIMRAFRHT